MPTRSKQVNYRDNSECDNVFRQKGEPFDEGDAGNAAVDHEVRQDAAHYSSSQVNPADRDRRNISPVSKSRSPTDLQCRHHNPAPSWKDQLERWQDRDSNAAVYLKGPPKSFIQRDATTPPVRVDDAVSASSVYWDARAAAERNKGAVDADTNSWGGGFAVRFHDSHTTQMACTARNESTNDLLPLTPAERVKQRKLAAKDLERAKHEDALRKARKEVLEDRIALLRNGITSDVVTALPRQTISLQHQARAQKNTSPADRAREYRRCQEKIYKQRKAGAKTSPQGVCEDTVTLTKPLFFKN